MTFTEEQERVLKLMVNETIARQKLNFANRKMGDEIRAEFKPTDDRIRAENKETLDSLLEDFNKKTAEFKAEFE